MKIERSNSHGRFSPEQLAANVRESRAFWSSPDGKARKAQLDREQRNRPATTMATAASRAYWNRRLAFLEKTASI